MRYILIPFKSDTANKIVAYDKKLLAISQVKTDTTFLRFFQWEKTTLSYGINQTLTLQDKEYYLKKKIDTIHRPSGGGRVLHDGDLCFSLIWHQTDPNIPWKTVKSYCKIHKWISRSLERIGYKIKFSSDQKNQFSHSLECFQNPVKYDILDEKNRKIVGGGQWRQRSTTIHQGSIQISNLQEKIQTFTTEFEKTFDIILSSFTSKSV